MVSIADVQIDLFGAETPSLDEIKQLSNAVNQSERNRLAFSQLVEDNSGKGLSTGIGLFILGRNKEAVEELQKAGDSMEKLIFLGKALRKIENYDEAIKSFDKGTKKQADALMVGLEKTATLRLANKLDEAEKAIKQFGNFEKVSAEYHFQLGKLLDAQGEYEEAFSNYEMAIELDPGHQEGLFHLGFACDLRGDEDAAIDYYKQVLKNSPVYVNALLNLAVLYEDMGEFDHAWNCVEAVLLDHPNHKKAELFSKDIESSMVMIYDEEKERRQNRHTKTLEIPISDFELSVRSRNCLKKMNILSLGDLLRTSEAELLAYKNFGETSLIEIKKVLDSKGLSLGMALENSTTITAEPGENGADETLLSKTVEDLELSVRAKRALSRLNIASLGELVSKTEAELLGCKNFGVTSLNEIKERLTVFGLSLRKLD